MSIDELLGPASVHLLRNEPVQARSAARLGSLLDAAAEVVDEVGFERLTTAMVAERAHASIGTVYRYFPDRIAVLEGLSSRAFRRFLDRILDLYRENRLESLDERVAAAIDTYADLYRHEQGFRVVRFADVVDVHLLDGRRTSSTALVQALADLAEERGQQRTAELVFRLGVVITLAGALVHRAFESSAEGDPRLLAEAKQVSIDYLHRHVVRSGG